MGTKHDLSRRRNWRIDGSGIWDSIKKARKLIFEHGFGPKSKKVGRALQVAVTSLLPTRVSIFFVDRSNFILPNVIERLFDTSRRLRLQFLLNVCP